MVESRIYADRRTAGIELGRLLEVEYKDRHALVIGIPRGGVEVAYYVAKILNGDLCAVISKKLPFPGHEELAFGAVTEDGSVFLTALARHLNEETINLTIEKQVHEIRRRVNKYREGRPLPIMVNRLVILVDDGIATGATLVPALRLCRDRGASKIVVAAPISGEDYVEEIASLADEIKIAERPDDFFAVGQAYECFPSLTDNDVKRFLEKFRKGI
jgi:putative phosphoribosyl transferase